VEARSTFSTWWPFVRGLLRAPRSVGAIAPSSPWLVRAVLEPARISQAKTLVEFGPGTGALTGEIIRRLRPDARLFAFEVDREFVADLRARYRDPRVTFIAASAADCPQYLSQFGLTTVDCVVSSLPLTVLPRPLTHRIMKATTECLRPGGIFVTYQFSTAFARPVLQSYFPQTRRTRFVLANLPPAMVFACRKETEAVQRWPSEACLVGDAAY
jgi:phosphatidylethanolamine/phosphatidyl-N-methylethanolamine N-methyltransferase